MPSSDHQKIHSYSPTRAHSFEAIGAFNPSVVTQADKHGTMIQHVFYRAMAEPNDLRTPGRGIPTIGYAKSNDGGETFGTHQQVISASESWEAYGCEDPRATFFEGKWYVSIPRSEVSRLAQRIFALQSR